MKSLFRWLPRKGPHKNWVDLDNASKIFLSAMNATDTKVFRFTATLRDEIEPQLLQQALDHTYDRFPLYQGVIRRGFFWYYYEESKLRPVVQPETQSPCMALYHYDMKELMFRVLYYQKRIHLEVFHALSDGTGASWFLQLLVANYIVLRYPHDLQVVAGQPQAEYILEQQIDDSFARYFRQTERDTILESTKRQLGKARRLAGRSWRRSRKRKRKHIYHIRGFRTQDNRMQVFETEMPVQPVLELARSRGTTLSIFLTAIFIEAIYRSIPSKRRVSRDWTIAVSVPINLRQFYPSQSARNFFATLLIEHRFTREAADDSLEALCQDIGAQFKEQMGKKNLEKKLRSLAALERNVAIRPILRPIKDLILRFANAINNRKITAALSNMGRISFPEGIEAYVDQVYVYTSAARPQFASVTHKDILTINFTSPFQNTEIQMNFIRRLVDLAVPVTIGANEVNPQLRESRAQDKAASPGPMRDEEA